MVEFTDAAAAEVRRRLQAEGLNDHHLRLGVQGGGCSGLTYVLNFDSQIGQFDKVFDVKGVKVVIDLKSALYLKGVVIDYVAALVGGGFKFQNPNASKACGCGTSFSA
ncbi:MAG: iron-sulfur cluster assembly accessory protein [candidate division Zixibacteria bacterium]|nr:iron-sulfur cluster assembly accessory protein [candidate division Zixibacteria bacterium]